MEHYCCLSTGHGLEVLCFRHCETICPTQRLLVFLADLGRPLATALHPSELYKYEPGPKVPNPSPLPPSFLLSSPTPFPLGGESERTMTLKPLPLSAASE